MNLLLLCFAVAMWWQLPLITITSFGYTEVRVYDLLILAEFGLCFYHKDKLKMFFLADPVGYWLIRYLWWASFGYVVTVFWVVLAGKPERSLILIIHLYHLWGFSLLYPLCRIGLRNRADAFRMLDVFLVVGLLEAILIILQGSGVVGMLWNERYAGYGERAFSGTLGPNRTVPGHALLLFLAACFSYIRNSLKISRWRFIFSAFSGMVGVIALLVTGSRTAWIAAVVFLGVYICLSRHKLFSLLTVIVVAIGAYAVLPESVSQQIAEMYEWKITGKLKNVSSDADLSESFDAIDNGRSEIWLDVVTLLMERPWLIPFGAGFHNFAVAFRAYGSPHNMYLNLITDLGIPGLFLFMAWNLSQLKQLRICNWYARGDLRHVVYGPVEAIALFAAIAVSQWGGEILYCYRSSFAFGGMYMLVMGVLGGPAWVFDSSGWPENAGSEGV